jgi:hypothetical protein
MAGAGRPPKKLGHIDNLEGSDREKRQLRIILATITGDRTVRQASRDLGLCEARFHELRRQVLQVALNELTPGRPGRPRKEDPLVTRRVRELEDQVLGLEIDLQTEKTRKELAMMVPEVLRDKKNEVEAKTRRRRRRRR